MLDFTHLNMLIYIP